MKEIVKVLLAEGISEEVIHEVLSTIEEKYEVVDETLVQQAEKKAKKAEGALSKYTGAVRGKLNLKELPQEQKDKIMNTAGLLLDKEGKAQELVGKAKKLQSPNVHSTRNEEGKKKQEERQAAKQDMGEYDPQRDVDSVNWR